MCVESLDADGSVDEEIVPWIHYGTRSYGVRLSNTSIYTPTTIAADTMATRFTRARERRAKYYDKRQQYTRI